MGKYHNVLYIALKISWNWGIKDSKLICELLSKLNIIKVERFITPTKNSLEEIYDCEETFERIFLGAIFGSNAPYFIAGWRSDFRDQVTLFENLIYTLNSLSYKLFSMTGWKFSCYGFLSSSFLPWAFIFRNKRNKSSVSWMGKWEMEWNVDSLLISCLIKKRRLCQIIIKEKWCELWLSSITRALNKKVFYLLYLNSFIDVPIESCGRSSPLRVSLQATAPDILLIFLRYGANPYANDGGSSPVEALLEKLKEYDESSSYPYQLVSCFKIFMLSIPFIELPYKVGVMLL